MRIEKSVTISKPLPEVFNFLKHTRNQDLFSVWNMADPAMKKEHTGTDGTTGFIYRWDSSVKNVGAGEQETKAINDGKSIEFEIRFFRPMQNTAKAFFHTESSGGGSTTVRWIFDSPSKFPFSLLSPVFKRMLGKDLEKGLLNLKGLMEK